MRCREYARLGRCGTIGAWGHRQPLAHVRGEIMTGQTRREPRAGDGRGKEGFSQPFVLAIRKDKVSYTVSGTGSA